MKNTYDVIVIGAGPAGGSAARELAQLGKRVVLLERSKILGEPNYSTAGTPLSTAEDFGLPDEVLAATWNTLIMRSPNEEAVWRYPDVAGYVLDFRKLKQFLAHEAKAHGAELILGATAKQFIIEKEQIVGVTYADSHGTSDLHASVVIDATGGSEFANNQLNVNSTPTNVIARGMEYQLPGIPEQYKDTMAFMLGHSVVPQGYAWVFTMNDNTEGKVGVCVYGTNDLDTNLKQYQDQFVASIPEYDGIKPLEIHGGSMRVDGGVAHHVHQNVILIGDAARQINPLGGEGVRHGLYAGRLAARTIESTLHDGVLNERAFKHIYERVWKKQFKRDWRISYAFSQNVYLKMTDDELDEMVRIIKTIKPADMFAIFFSYRFRRFLKYPHVMFSLFKHSKHIIPLLFADNN